ADGLVRGPAGAHEVAALDRLPDRAAARSQRQALQAQAARSLVGGTRTQDLKTQREQGRSQPGERRGFGYESDALLVEDEAVRHAVSLDDQRELVVPGRQSEGKVHRAGGKRAGRQEAVAIAAEARLVLLARAEQRERAGELRTGRVGAGGLV